MCTLSALLVRRINNFPLNMGTHIKYNWRGYLEGSDAWLGCVESRLECHFGPLEVPPPACEVLAALKKVRYYTYKLACVSRTTKASNIECTEFLGGCVRQALTVFCLRSNDSKCMAAGKLMQLGPQAAMQLLRSFSTISKSARDGVKQSALDDSTASLFHYLVEPDQGKTAFMLFEAVFHGIVEPFPSAERTKYSRPRHMASIIKKLKMLQGRFEGNNEAGGWPSWMDGTSPAVGDECYNLGRFFRDMDFSNITMGHIVSEVVYYCHAVIDFCASDEFDRIMGLLPLPALLVDHKLPNKFMRTVSGFEYPKVRDSATFDATIGGGQPGFTDDFAADVNVPYFRQGGIVETEGMQGPIEFDQELQDILDSVTNEIEMSGFSNEVHG